VIVLDTTVLVYVVSADHPLREPCRDLIDSIASGRLRATTTIDVLQEFTHVRARRRDREDAARCAHDCLELLTPLLVVGEDDLEQGLRIYTRSHRLGAFDCVLAATAGRSGAAAIVSADAAFGEADIRHVVPDAAGVADLLASCRGPQPARAASLRRPKRRRMSIPNRPRACKGCAMTSRRYVPAAGRVGSTRSYDRSIAVTMREERWRPLLRSRVLSDVPENGHVVDVGAGTGTLSIALARERADVMVTAVDGDAEILELAKAKPGAELVQWRKGLADALPLETASADAVVTSLLLHHLDRNTKQRALVEIARVLRPGGRLHIADWGRPATPLLRASFLVLQLLDGFDGTRDHAAGRIPELVRASGFSGVHVYAHRRTLWGTLELIEARKSA
jgi:predicted nucleic acid-binding protein/SAM-dependent methyltransferase